MQLKQPLHELLLPALTAAQKAYFDTIHLSPVHVRMSLHTHTLAQTHTCVRAQTRTYTHTHTHTHTHKHCSLSSTCVQCSYFMYVHATNCIRSPPHNSSMLVSLPPFTPVITSPSFSLCFSPLLWSPLPPFLCASHPSCGPLSLLFSVLLTPPVVPSPSFSLCFSPLLWSLPLQIILSLSLMQTLSSKEEMQEESLSVFSGLDPLSNIKSILQSLGTFIVDVRQAELK